MMIKFVFKLSIIFSVFFSSCCNNQSFEFESYSIDYLTSELDEGNKEISNIRLAFAKTFAKALENVAFREYILNMSLENSEGSFNEIIFSIHSEKIIEDGVSFATHMLNSIDNEVITLFGDNFIDIVLENDPLLAIKIPDVFYNLNWETEKFSPLVLAKTPVFLNIANKNFYQSYHSSRYQHQFNINSNPDYYFITIKYSEDYILVNNESLLTEKDITIFDVIHQLKSCWTDIKEVVFEKGVLFKQYPNMYFLNKLDLINIHKEYCEPLSFNFGDFSNCNQACKRDCLESNEIENVIEKISINPLIFLDNFKLSFFIEENCNFLFFISDIEIISNNFLIDAFDVSSLRKLKIHDWEINISLEIENTNFNEIGNVVLARTTLNVEPKLGGNNLIVINHLFDYGWSGKNKHDFNIILYYQFENLNRIEYINDFEIAIPIYSTFAQSIGRGTMSYCDNPNTNYNFGIMDIFVNY